MFEYDPNISLGVPAPPKSGVGHLSNPDENAGNAPEAEEDELIRKDFQLYEAHTLLRGVSILASKKAP